MKYLITLLAVGLIASSGLAADSLYIHQGIHGMKWGSLVSDYDGLTKVHEKKQAAFYFSPLSDSLNQEQLDQIPDKAYGPAPAEDAGVDGSVPLLDY